MKALAGALLGALLGAGSAQAGPGLDLQLYPAGVQALALWRHALPFEKALLAYGGVNLTRRWDWGRHADERGWGPGLGLGLDWHPGGHAWFGAMRVEAWSLQIDWTDPGRSGQSRVLVLQPALELGWTWPFGLKDALESALSLGQEMNVSTDGEAVGQGPILRWRIGWRL